MLTTPDSFELRKSKIPNAGLGVFVLVDIPEDTFLALKPKNTTVGVLRSKSEIPAKFIHYCIAKENDMYQCPKDFNNMELVWYLNHSQSPNAELRTDGYYAAKSIMSGDEVLIDYNVFNEPEDKKKAFYKN